MSAAFRMLWLAAACTWTGVLAGRSLREDDAILCALVGLGLCALTVRRRGLVWPAIFFSAVGIGACSTADLDGQTDRPRRIAGEVVKRSPRRNGWLLTLESAPRTTWRIHVPRHGVAHLDSWPAGFGVGARIAVLVRARGLRAASASSVRIETRASGTARLRGIRDAALDAMRARVRRRLHDPSNPASGGVLLALLTGDRSALPPRLARDLRDSGLAHFAVMSGLHVGLLVMFVCGPLAIWLGKRHPLLTSATTAVGLAAFALFPAAPPIRRAAMAAVAFQAARLAARGVTPLHALAGLVVVLVCVHPPWAASVSLALSVSATAAILLAASCPASLPRPVRAGLTMLAPALASWPWIVWISGRMAPWGFVLTPVASLPFALSMGLGVACIAWPVDGAVSAWLAARCLEITGVTIELVAWAAELPGSGRLAAPVGGVWLGLHLVLLAAALRAHTRARLAVAMALVLLVATWPMRRIDNAPADLVAIDVGQGQAVLLAQGEHRVLVDAGDGRRINDVRLLDQLRDHSSRRLDALIVTHADLDHRGGVETILRALDVQRLAVPQNALDHPALGPALAAAARRGIAVIPLSAGDERTFGRLSLRVLHPAPGQARAGNESSLVMHARAGDLSALLPADAGRPSESRWAHACPRNVDVLLVAHHGADAGASPELLHRLQPKVALISCGQDNRFGHPHPRTLAQLRRAGISARTTSRYGSIAVQRVGPHLELSFVPSQ